MRRPCRKNFSGTPGLVLTAPFMFLGRIMFKELDTPKDQNVHDAPQKKQ